MLLPNQQDAIHRAWLYRLLMHIYDDPALASTLYFKGGTCAAMLGYLDRFSVDLDFDYAGKPEETEEIRKKMEKIFADLGLEIKDKSRKIPQYFLRYPARKDERNTLKIDVTFPVPKANKYQTVRFPEIDRIITCQTPETMFANKLVALIERWEKNEAIAGRDVYDIHHFFLQGFRFENEVIEERRKQKAEKFFAEMIDFVQKRINDTIISQDLNVLLPYDKFRKIRKTLKQEVLIFLNDELEKMKMAFHNSGE